MKLCAPFRFLMATGIAAAIALPAAAQQYDAPNLNDRQDNRRMQQRDDRSQDRSQSRDRRDARFRMNLDGLVRIGVDYDGDGQIDARQTLYRIDLERAKQQSQARRQQAERRGFRSDRTARDQQQRSQQRRSLHAMGEIQRLERKTIMGSEEKKVVATLQDRERRPATVILGSQSKVRQLDLQEGDTVRVQGQVARLDDRPVLLAQMVAANGQTIRNELPQKQNLKRFEGEILSTRKANFRGRDEQYLVARVRSEEQGTRQINLGRASELEDLDISEGTQIKVLARQGRINNQDAFIAQVVHVDGQSVDVREPTRRTLQQREGQNRRQRDRTERDRTERGSSGQYDAQRDRDADRSAQRSGNGPQR